MKRRVITQHSPLSRDRIMRVATELADQSGVDSLTMRGLATALGVQAMSLYNHVSNKRDLLDGMVDLIFTEIAQSTAVAGDWKSVVRARAIAARAVLSRHPWAVTMLESSSLPGSATMRHFDDMLGCLRRAGLSIDQTLHAYTVIFAYVYGFVLALDDDHLDQAKVISAADRWADYPHALEVTDYFISRKPVDQTHDFVTGLDLILDGIERALFSRP